MTISEIAKQYIGVNYLWGGSDPMSGFDCSGLVLECLAGVGVRFQTDMNAQALYNHFKDKKISTAQKDALVFYGSAPDHITHIAIAINENQIIEAGGGGRDTVTIDVAKRRDAFVKVRPINYRKDLQSIVMPTFPF